MNVREFIDSLDLESEKTEVTFAPREVVVNARTGQPRQAGTTESVEGKFIVEFRQRAERSLYVFAKGVYGRDYLSPGLHLTACDWLQNRPPYRKLLLFPRKHCKTSIVSHVLPAHILIQPAETNCYLPGRDGANTRILLAGEAETRASNNLRVVEAAFENKPLLRALWPHRCWENPRKEAKVWNSSAMVIPRSLDYPDPSIQVVGVDGSITGARFDVMIKDDLISVAAANSAVVMDTAIRWHEASRALLDREDSLEFIIGTRWAIADLYAHIIQNDPSVEVLCRSIIEDGQPIYPEFFSLEPEFGKTCIEDLRKESGSLFPLIYMNSAAHPELTDFQPGDIREFEIRGERVVFDEDERDIVLAERQNAPRVQPSVRGMPLNKRTASYLLDRGQGYLRLKYG